MSAFFLRKKKEEAASGGAWLLVGLGNPGREYEKTWHNLGFLCLEVLQRRHGFRCDRLKGKGLTAKTRLFGGEQIFLMPQTYMNASGESVRELSRFYKIPPERILLVLDDFDLPLGKLRLRHNGSGGTHNGLRSVIYQLNTDQFPRLRIGFGPKPEHIPVVDYVLHTIPEQEVKTVAAVLEKAADTVDMILRGDFEAALRLANSGLVEVK